MMTLENRIVGKRSGEYQLLSLTLRGVIPRHFRRKWKIPAEFDVPNCGAKGFDFLFV
jgi:hypothetical protein